jgi:hypothetical protein
MKKAIFLLIIVGLFCSSFKSIYKEETHKIFKENETVLSSIEKLESEIEQTKRFVSTDSNYNTEIGFFIDMGITSGKNRFFIYDFKNNKIIGKGLVGHGSGSETGIKGQLKFSNTKDSRCTSLGRYAIGNAYKGMFGKAYKIYGLDETNNNAFDRSVVLHSYSAVPYEEQENEICRSYGCPMVNEMFFEDLAKIIDTSKKKIVLTIYY